MREIVKKMKNGIAPGPDEITVDILKGMNDENLDVIRQLINQWWTEQTIPEDLTLAKVVSLYKKGNPEIQENYRPVSLLNTYYKLIVAGIQRRLAKALDN